MKNELIAKGMVQSLSVNGRPVPDLYFAIDGPLGDIHAGFVRKLSGHDGAYRATSVLKKGDLVLNWRSWTGLSFEELVEIESTLGVEIPPGCLLENIIVSGIPNFSELSPTSRLVFPQRKTENQLILAVWEKNDPCHGVGSRLEAHHGIKGLSTRFIAAALDKRGVMGPVLSAGWITVGDEVLVYPPVQ